MLAYTCFKVPFGAAKITKIITAFHLKLVKWRIRLTKAKRNARIVPLGCVTHHQKNCQVSIGSVVLSVIVSQLSFGSTTYVQDASCMVDGSYSICWRTSDNLVWSLQCFLDCNTTLLVNLIVIWSWSDSSLILFSWASSDLWHLTTLLTSHVLLDFSPPTTCCARLQLRVLWTLLRKTRLLRRGRVTEDYRLLRSSSIPVEIGSTVFTMARVLYLVFTSSHSHWQSINWAAKNSIQASKPHFFKQLFCIIKKLRLQFEHMSTFSFVK